MAHSTRVIAVLSGKGGVGKTFVSLHVALGLAEDNRRTLLVDFDLHGGGVLASALGVKPQLNLLDAYRVAPEQIPIPISRTLSLVGAPNDLRNALMAQRSDLSGALSSVFRGFEWAVIDLSHRLDLATISALSVSHGIWLVTTGDPFSMYATEVMLGRLCDLGLDVRRVRLILNGRFHYDFVSWRGLDPYVIPYDKSVEGVTTWNGVYSQVCAQRLKWFALEEAGRVRVRIDLPEGRASNLRAAHDRSHTSA